MRYGYCTMIDKRIGQEREGEKNGSNRLSTIRIRASDIISIRVWLFITLFFSFYHQTIKTNIYHWKNK